MRREAAGRRRSSSPSRESSRVGAFGVSVASGVESWLGPIELWGVTPAEGKGNAGTCAVYLLQRSFSSAPVMAALSYVLISAPGCHQGCSLSSAQATSKAARARATQWQGGEGMTTQKVAQVELKDRRTPSKKLHVHMKCYSKYM